MPKSYTRIICKDVLSELMSLIGYAEYHNAIASLLAEDLQCKTTGFTSNINARLAKLLKSDNHLDNYAEALVFHKKTP